MMRRLFVLSTIVLLLPAVSWAKGPIVRTSLDWLSLMWTILINNT